MANVSAVKPAVGGGVWIAPEGTTLPTDASTALASAWKSLGYIDENGVTRGIEKDTTTVNAWGGDVVAVLSNKKTETFQFKCIEPDNLDVLGLTFGSATGALATGITVQSTAAQDTAHAMVISTLLKDGIKQRICIPSAVVTAVGNVQYVDNAVLGFDLTLTAIADSNGVTAYEYMVAASAPTT